LNVLNSDKDTSGEQKKEKRCYEFLKKIKEYLVNTCTFKKKRTRSGKELWEIAKTKYGVIHKKKVFENNCQLINFIH
jgi:hypothetical protein